jgi:hypothetical protein
MRQLLLNLLAEPNRENYVALHASVTGSPEYSPYSDELNTISSLIEQQRYDTAREQLQRAIVNLLLSPRAHLVSAFLHSKAGDEASVELEMALRDACRDGILATGDGTEAQPYLVSRPSDEHDILEHLGKQLRKQGLRTRSGRHYDHIVCTDGAELWFDITAAFRSLRNR